MSGPYAVAFITLSGGVSTVYANKGKNGLVEQQGEAHQRAVFDTREQALAAADEWNRGLTDPIYIVTPARNLFDIATVENVTLTRKEGVG